jgi:hypothetical protein
VLFLLIIALVCSAILGWSVWLDFFTAVTSTYREGSLLGVTQSSMLNLRGVLAVILGSSRTLLVDSISYYIFILALILTVIIWSDFVTKQQLFNLMFGLSILLSLLFGLHVHPQDGLLMVFPTYILYDQTRGERKFRRVLADILVLCPIVLLVYRFMLQKLLMISVEVFLMIILLLWTIARIHQTIRLNESSST